MMHFTENGIEEDDDGFYFASCSCGAGIGPAPDEETLVDMAMEHVRFAVILEMQQAAS